MNPSADPYELAVSVAPSLPRISELDFLSDEAPAAPIDRLVYEDGITTFNGATKVGKTWAALQMLMCLATGTPFLGLTAHKVPVLLISLEMAAALIRQRMTAIARDVGIPMPKIDRDFFLVAHTRDTLVSLDVCAPSGRECLEQTVRETGARVVCIDTLFRAASSADPIDNKAMGALFGHLADLAHRTRVALFVQDHTRKGDLPDAVSHSGLGAQAKGAAARTIISLRRTSRDDGGRWALDVESHHGNWDEALYYERPRLPNGERGSGCVPCSATEAFALDLSRIVALFHEHGDRDAGARSWFPSQRKLIAALIESKLASGNETAQARVRAIEADWSVEGLAIPRDDRPIAIGRSGQAKTYTLAVDPILKTVPDRPPRPAAHNGLHGDSDDFSARARFEF